MQILDEIIQFFTTDLTCCKSAANDVLIILKMREKVPVKMEHAASLVYLGEKSREFQKIT